MRAAMIALLLLLVPIAAGAEMQDFPAHIVWVVDGDSIRFTRITNGREARDECRMLHYNAPEMTGDERKEGQKALRHLINLIAKKDVFIRGEKRDKYGRLLCEVRLKDGTYINDEMRKFLKDFPRRDIYLWKERQDGRGDNRKH